MMPSGRASRLAIIQLSTPVTIPSKMKILCTYPALCPRNGPLPYIIQTSGEGGICLVDSSIHPYFAPKARRNNRKAPASPPHHKSGRSRSGQAPGQSEGE